VGPRTGMDDVEKRKFLTLPRLEPIPLGRPARSQSLYRLRYPGYLYIYIYIYIYMCVCVCVFVRTCASLAPKWFDEFYSYSAFKMNIIAEKIRALQIGPQNAIFLILSPTDLWIPYH
jgi:hypothetical protein